MHAFDDVDSDTYRALIMWADPMVILWNCSRCNDFEVGSLETKPQTKGCRSALKFHSWRRIKNMSKSKLRVEVAA